jgi:hypothetical protein
VCTDRVECSIHTFQVSRVLKMFHSFKEMFITERVPQLCLKHFRLYEYLTSPAQSFPASKCSSSHMFTSISFLNFSHLTLILNEQMQCLFLLRKHKTIKNTLSYVSKKCGFYDMKFNRRLSHNVKMDICVSTLLN